MQTIVLDLPDYHINIGLQIGQITFICNETRMEFEMDPTRVYNFPKEVREIQYDQEPMQYIRIYFNEGPDTKDGDFMQIKLESSSCIVLDMFDKDGELLDEIGAWDFWTD